MQRYFKITFLMSEGKGIMHVVCVEIVVFNFLRMLVTWKFIC